MKLFNRSKALERARIHFSYQNLSFIFFILLLVILKNSIAAENILVARYDNWHHPVLKVFKKYNIELYKVSYSQRGTCPTFFAKFKYSPDPRGPASDLYFNKIYAEILNANSNFPYALVDKLDNLKINVGLRDKEKSEMVVNIGKASSLSTCLDGIVNPDSEKITIDLKMKEQIKRSTFKVTLQRSNGKKITAYLYATDEKIKPFEYKSCSNGRKLKTKLKTGHYYIYLYDDALDSFYPTRTPVLSNHDKIRMNIEGSDFFALRTTEKNQSDVLLISQRADCIGNFYEAYGFWKDQPSLQKYLFNDGKRFYQFLGNVNKSQQADGNFIYYRTDTHNTNYEILSVSNNEREVQLKAR